MCNTSCDNEEEEGCYLCQRQEGTVRSGRCGLLHHCQDQADRHSSLAQCFPVRVERSASQGRYLVATRQAGPLSLVGLRSDTVL